ncbi:MAG: acyltransferase [Bacteriovorax sp.]|nr:acyltransferase [Bacteriovorax sp.]
MDKRVPSLDLLRAIAISLVLLLHCQEFVTGLSNTSIYLFSYGWIGVDLFFVLSGFLIGSQAFNSKENESSPIIKFLTKRFFRTMPLYYFILLIYIFIKPLVGFPFNDNKIKFFFFLQNFFSPKDFVQSWSLCIEEQFYILFSVIFFKFELKKIPSYLWLMPGLFSILVRLFFYQSGIEANTLPTSAYNYQFNFFAHLDGIAWGIFLASTFNTWSKYKNKMNILAVGILLLMITLIYIGPNNLNSKVILSYQLLAMSFSLILVGLYDFKKIPFGKVIQYLATWSYGIYLWNNLTARFISKALFAQSNFLKFSIYILVTVLLSAFTYYLIEKPTLKLRNNLLSKIK